MQDAEHTLMMRFKGQRSEGYELHCWHFILQRLLFNENFEDLIRQSFSENLTTYVI